MSTGLVRVNQNKCRQGSGWRITNQDGEIVADWVPSLILLNATFYVSQLGRRNAVETGERKLHAWIQGVWDEGRKPMEPVNDMRRILYNPKLNTTFVYADTQETVFAEPRLLFYPDGVYASRS